MAAVTGLLVVVALGTRGHSWGGGSRSTRQLPQSFWDYVFSAALVLWIAVGTYAIYRYFQMRRRSEAEGSWRGTIRAVLFFLLVVMALSLIAPHLKRNPAPQTVHGQHGHGQQGTPQPAQPTPTHRPHPRSAHGHFRWPAAAGVALVLLAALAAYLLYRSRKRKTHVGKHREAALALAQVLDDTLDDLRRERDPRKAVIAAYARMERTLAAYGLPRVPSEAPEEYLHRMLAELDVSGASARRLTALFERAKFSPHEVDAGMKDEAIDALVALRNELMPPAETTA